MHGSLNDCEAPTLCMMGWSVVSYFSLRSATSSCARLYAAVSSSFTEVRREKKGMDAICAPDQVICEVLAAAASRVLAPLTPGHTLAKPCGAALQ